MSLITIVNAVNAELKHNMEMRDALVTHVRQLFNDRVALLAAEEKQTNTLIDTIEREFADRDAALRKLVAETE